MRALGRVLDRIFDVFEWLVHKVLDLWNRVWKSGRYPEKVRDEYIGVNGVPLLATLTLFGLWYVLPLARLLEIDETRFILVGAAIWIAAVIAWRSRCREDRRGAGARWAQTVAVTCGLRRLDQIGLLLAGTMCWLARSEAQLWPLAIACVVTFVALLIQDHEPRQTLKVYAVPQFSSVASSAELIETSPGDTFEVKLDWRLGIQGCFHQHSASVSVSMSRLSEARSATPKHSAEITDMVYWVVNGNGPEVEQLARQIHDQVFRGGYSLYGAVSCYVAACQSIPYRPDDANIDGGEHWRYPIETLGDREGDCEDKSILLAALLRRSGYSCALLDLPGHIAVGVRIPDDVPGSYLEVDGRHYYYCETTATGWRVGDVPPECVGVDVHVMPVPPMEAT